MERAIDVLRFAVISPELCAALLCLGISVYWPGLFEAIGKAAGQEAGIALPLCLSVWALAGYAASLTRDLLMPTEASAKVLAKWPDHDKLRNRALATILICAACALVVGAAMFLRSSISPVRLGFLLAVGVLDALISVWCLLNATLQVRKLLDSESL